MRIQNDTRFIFGHNSSTLGVKTHILQFTLLYDAQLDGS